MARRFPLQVLLDLTRDHTDSSARTLSVLKGQWLGAEEKLGQLQQYEGEYRARLLQSTEKGMQVAEIRNFQQFLIKLAVAITQQREEVERCKGRWEQGQLEWLQHKQKLNAYDTLSERHRKKELQVESAQEQRDQDELSSKKRFEEE